MHSVRLWWVKSKFRKPLNILVVGRGLFWLVNSVSGKHKKKVRFTKPDKFFLCLFLCFLILEGPIIALRMRILIVRIRVFYVVWFYKRNQLKGTNIHYLV